MGMKDFLLLFSSLLKGGLGWGKQQLRLHWIRLTPLPSPPIQWGTAKEFRYTSPLLPYSSAYNTWFSLFIWFREGTKKIGRSFFSLSEKKLRVTSQGSIHVVDYYGNGKSDKGKFLLEDVFKNYTSIE